MAYPAFESDKHPRGYGGKFSTKQSARTMSPDAKKLHATAMPAKPGFRMPPGHDVEKLFRAGSHLGTVKTGRTQQVGD